MRIALGIEYDGRPFHGWQRQKNADSVQAFVEAALSDVANESIITHCAGRTDSGVHACEQVIHFDTTAERQLHAWVLGVNTKLPREISVLWSKVVSDDFHARFSAFERRYRYIIFNRKSRPGLLHKKVTWEYTPLDLGLMQTAAESLVGEHDFSSFRALACQAKSPIKTVKSLEVSQHGNYFYIDIEANAFLHHMVRNIAGVLMSIGRGDESVSWCKEVLEKKDRTQGGKTAAPDGLYLVSVAYPEPFEIQRNPVLPYFS
ncbi:MAG: tRNA pseudouridine(38-40) synthase TruA [Gammaproteobacteria bacterium]|nr:tRNA pseudouridine(38-40) synthase TruA [Gammaproteobacteria bacterium]